jgi:DNA-binding NarL/FixJ family response regulator
MNALTHLLLLEDDAIEIMKFERVIQKLDTLFTLSIANNGAIALDMLQQTKEHLPELILLDLNMPNFNGIEFIRSVKKEATWCHIPCVVLTTSDNRIDLMDCYREGIAGYFLKPLRYDDYLALIQSILAYWNNSHLV